MSEQLGEPLPFPERPKPSRSELGGAAIVFSLHTFRLWREAGLSIVEASDASRAAGEATVKEIRQRSSI